ncbi:conjugal transfer protein [Nocardiopsis sp. TSRI0078]|uniref:conjugal transfer protein n=1 Tax=unclassified Nocardiopsis TaxID=2649073 RepID=UPI00093C483F|nr:conjugal transfer protein [Nocardiopsis sp. TSRI0078]OKI14456.1 conjugal transfer protein [Nocardiopsis sp. TSRI0078]
MANASRRGTAARDREDGGGEFDAPRARKLRAGAGGRWWVGVGRAVLWAFIIVVVFNGIWFPLRGGFALPSASEEPESSDTVAYPETAAAAFGLRFAEAYLDTADPEERLSDLAAFVPEGEAADLDVPADSLTGENLTVVAVDVADDHNALVVVRADVNGEPMRLDVPVYADGDALVVSGSPALLAAPTRASLPEGSSFETDPRAREQLEEVLPGFFEAYAGEPAHLERYLEPGAAIAPLPENSLEFAELSDITVPSQASNGNDDIRQAAVTVRWNLPAPDGDEAGQLTQNYLVTVVNSGSEWHVRDIQGAPRSFGE